MSTPGGKGAVLQLESSTTYLPADARTNAILIATLSDPNYAPLANRDIDFSFEAPGQDAQEIGVRSTDVNGTARASVKPDEESDGVLLRAPTKSLNSQVSIMVGPPVTSQADQKGAVVKALTQQRYTDVEADYSSEKAPTGETTNTGFVGMRMVSQTFDRAVLSQMSRAFGTLRTVFPKADVLGIELVYRKDSHDWSLVWSANAAYWDQFVAGKISEDDFWRYVSYEGAWDENGNPIGDKNFIDKNFGAGRLASARIAFISVSQDDAGAPPEPPMMRGR